MYTLIHCMYTLISLTHTHTYTLFVSFSRIAPQCSSALHNVHVRAFASHQTTYWELRRYCPPHTCAMTHSHTGGTHRWSAIARQERTSMSTYVCRDTWHTCDCRDTWHTCELSLSDSEARAHLLFFTISLRYTHTPTHSSPLLSDSEARAHLNDHICLPWHMTHMWLPLLNHVTYEWVMTQMCLPWPHQICVMTHSYVSWLLQLFVHSRLTKPSSESPNGWVLLSVHSALLNVCRALLCVCRALLSVYRTLLSAFTPQHTKPPCGSSDHFFLLCCFFFLRFFFCFLFLLEAWSALTPHQTTFWKLGCCLWY